MAQRRRSGDAYADDEDRNRAIAQSGSRGGEDVFSSYLRNCGDGTRVRRAIASTSAARQLCAGQWTSARGNTNFHVFSGTFSFTRGSSKMAEAATPPAHAPSIASLLKRDADGKPYLQGTKCGGCGHTFVGERSVCAQCFARDKMQSVRLAEKGKLYSFSIIHRSFPGVETPFIDIIVDLADGSHIKGILRGVEPVPEKVKFDMPVKIEYREIIPPGAKEKYLTYNFVPDA